MTISLVIKTEKEKTICLSSTCWQGQSSTWTVASAACVSSNCMANHTWKTTPSCTSVMFQVWIHPHTTYQLLPEMPDRANTRTAVSPSAALIKGRLYGLNKSHFYSLSSDSSVLTLYTHISSNLYWLDFEYLYFTFPSSPHSYLFAHR